MLRTRVISRSESFFLTDCCIFCLARLTEKLSRSAGFALEPDYTSSPAKAKVADTTSAEGAVGCSGLLGRYYRVQNHRCAVACNTRLGTTGAATLRGSTLLTSLLAKLTFGYVPPIATDLHSMGCK
jgi:hypothetical protein